MDVDARSSFMEVLEPENPDRHHAWLSRQLSTIRSPAVPSLDLIKYVSDSENAYIYEHEGLKNVYHLIYLCGLRPYHQVLEIGCGCGRNSQFVAPILDPVVGSYKGFDISKRAVEWADRAITSLYPNVAFSHVDIKNSHYNPEGAISANSYRFPYEDESFDIVFLPSVFTHMIRLEFEHYIREIHRVMKHDGRLLSWHYLLERSALERREYTQLPPNMVQIDDHMFVGDPMDPCSFVAYEKQYVLNTIDSAGLTVHATMRGNWSGVAPQGLVDYQDKILSVRQ